MITAIELDPQLQTADCDLSNNHFPPKIIRSRFELFKEQKKQKNEMQKAKAAREDDEELDDEELEEEEVQ